MPSGPAVTAPMRRPGRAIGRPHDVLRHLDTAKRGSGTGNHCRFRRCGGISPVAEIDLGVVLAPRTPDQSLRGCSPDSARVHSLRHVSAEFFRREVAGSRRGSGSADRPPGLPSRPRSRRRRRGGAWADLAPDRRGNLLRSRAPGSAAPVTHSRVKGLFAMPA